MKTRFGFPLLVATFAGCESRWETRFALAAQDRLAMAAPGAGTTYVATREAEWQTDGL